MSEPVHFEVALTRAAELARGGMRVFVVLHGLPEVMDGADEFFEGMRDYAGGSLMMTMPPMTWCCYMGYAEGEGDEYNARATVEVMTPRAFENNWGKQGDYDEVIHTKLPAGFNDGTGLEA